MVRLFAAFCKTLLENVCDVTAFHEATGRYRSFGKACPRCGAIGKLADYGVYTRGLTHKKHNKLVDSTLTPRRVKCDSCYATHALLPDIVIPYGRYSLSFVLIVLTAYFERTTTVEKICAQFGIAVSTLYEWKKRLALHKDLMLGVLISRKTNHVAFLHNLIGCDNLSGLLHSFFRKHGFSFMQRRSLSAMRSRPP